MKNIELTEEQLTIIINALGDACVSPRVGEEIQQILDKIDARTGLSLVDVRNESWKD